MRFVSRAGLGAAAIAGVLCIGTMAHAQYATSVTVSKCLAAQIKTAGKGAAADTGCYSKDAASADAVKLQACLDKQSAKGPAAILKADQKGPDCVETGQGPQSNTDTLAFAAAIDAQIPTGKCDGAKQKVIGKHVAGITGCYAKATKTGAVDNASGGCTDKVTAKTLAALNKADLKGPCTPVVNQDLIDDANDFIQSQLCLFDSGNAVCNPEPNNCQGGAPNGVLNAGEDCDPNGGGATSCATTANAGGTCTSKCNCLCPTSVTFSGDASNSASVLDTGWTGLGHRAPIIANGDVSVSLSCPGGGFTRPCGTCTLSGPVENPGPNQLHTRRCSGVLGSSGSAGSFKFCTSNADCGGALGTCEYYFGSNLPLVAGGVGTCVTNIFDGSIQGTANVESGESETTVFLTSRVHTGPTDNPCPKCVGVDTPNDGVKNGTCDVGPRAGQACDVNGSVPNRPSFGNTSLDCPPDPALEVAALEIDLSSSTNTVTKTLTASSPNCSDGSGQKCLCETCGNAAMNACDSDADCVPTGGGVCGGRRCIGGGNEGAACTTPGANTQCPDGLCGTDGEPSKPSACLDSTTTPGVLDCNDTAPVDGEGECVAGPVTKRCSIASGLGHKQCSTIADCGGGAGSCVSFNRPCFLTGGFSGLTGTNTLSAAGMEDTPMLDTSSPTLAAVFCVAPTTASAVNLAAGLPAPGRVTIKGTAIGHIP